MREKLNNIYRTMVRIRAFEGRVFKEPIGANIPGHGYLITKCGRTDRMMEEHSENDFDKADVSESLIGLAYACM